MIRTIFAAAALLTSLSVAAIAQTSLPVRVVPGGSDNSTASTAEAQPVGVHGCSGYPLSAAQADAAGNSVISFQITPQGTVASPVLSQSSGNPALDKAALLCVSGWLFRPAMKDGVAVADQSGATIQWRIADAQADTGSDSADVVSVPVWSKGGFRCEGWYAAGSQKPARAVILAFTVASDGSVQNVRKLQGSGSDKVDADAVECLQERHYQPATQHGQLVEFQLTDSLY
jgi:TonB family protein